jgi:hypothetical protein
MQTSIEWLYKQNKIILEMLLVDKINQSTFEQLDNCFKINMQQSKEIHKQEIIDAFKHGELPPLFVNLNAEQYYQETFKKN